LVVFVFTAGVNQYYGYYGYMPLDQSMIYNGAWRLLSGQIPYVDFWTPFGTIPILVQAGIFRAFGVSWTNYVLHASLMTGFFATCVMFAGFRLGLTLSVAALFGAIAGVIAYPPMGTPYVDNHAAIVSSLLVLGVVLGILDADKRLMWWLLAPPLAIVAFLCKQSPTIFVVAFCGVAIFFTAWLQGAIRDLIYVLVASMLCLLVTVLIFGAFGITWEIFRMQSIDSARAIAEQRTNDFSLVRLIRIGFGFFLPGTLLFLATLAAIRIWKFEPVVLSLCSAVCFLIFLVFATMTDNQPGTALALLAIVFLLTHAAFIRLFADRRFLFALAALPVIVAGAIQIGWTAPRYVNDFGPEICRMTVCMSTTHSTVLANYADGATISPQLAHLRWTIPSRAPGERDVNHYRDLLAELAKRSRPALFLSDSVLDPLVGQAPVAPALFWHAVLSFPVEGRAREIFDRQFKYDIIKSGSDLVVLDGAQTFMGIKIQDFPWLDACLRTDQARSIGGFSLIPLDVACVRLSLRS
jgi:hypothetical protein